MQYSPNPPGQFVAPQPPQDAGAASNDTSAKRAMSDAAQIIVTAILVAVAFGAGWFGNGYANRANVATGDQQLVLQAWNDIDQQYAVTSAIDHKKMAYAAINAIVTSLGDTGHSRFETAEQYADEQKQLNNAATVGIGVYLSGGGDKPLRVDATIPGSPADKNGNVKPGDEIVAVDGVSLAGKSIADARPLILGKEGTTVTLTLIRPSVSSTATFDVTLIRASFTVPTVNYYFIPDVNVAYIQLTSFAKDADAQLQSAIGKAKKQNAVGIVFDLRNDGGGYLDQAVAVSSEFIPASTNKNVLIVKSRTSTQTYPVTPGGLATTIPVEILVNNNTASAAEITAGAIAIDRPGVHVIGEKTFGTGTVLQPIFLSDGSALVLGIAEFYLPNGQSIYHNGYQPDQPVKLSDTVAPFSPLVASEEHLSYAQIQQMGDTQLLQGVNDLTGK